MYTFCQYPYPSKLTSVSPKFYTMAHPLTRSCLPNARVPLSLLVSTPLLEPRGACLLPHVLAGADLTTVERTKIARAEHRESEQPDPQ